LLLQQQVFRESIKLNRRYLTQLEIKQVSGNHWAFLVNPAEFEPVVAEFLDRIDS
jgi:hypothetical protein